MTDSELTGQSVHDVQADRHDNGDAALLNQILRVIFKVVVKSLTENEQAEAEREPEQSHSEAAHGKRGACRNGRGFWLRAMWLRMCGCHK